MWFLLIPLGLGFAYWGLTTKSVSRANPPPAPSKPIIPANAAQAAVLAATQPQMPTVFTNTTSGVDASTSGAQNIYRDVEVPNGGGGLEMDVLAAYDATQGKTDDDA